MGRLCCNLGRGSHGPTGECRCHGLRPICNAQLAEDSLQVTLDRELADMQCLSDLLVAFPLPYALEYAKLPGRDLASWVLAGFPNPERARHGGQFANTPRGKQNVSGEKFCVARSRAQASGIVIDEHEDAAIAEQIAHTMDQCSTFGRRNDRPDQRRITFDDERRMSPTGPQIADLLDRPLLGYAQLSAWQNFVFATIAGLGQPRPTGDGLNPYPERLVRNQRIDRPANPRGVLFLCHNVNRHLAHLKRIEYRLSRWRGTAFMSERHHLTGFQRARPGYSDRRGHAVKDERMEDIKLRVGFAADCRLLESQFADLARESDINLPNSTTHSGIPPLSFARFR